MKIEKYIEEKARKEWGSRLTKASHAVDEILSCIRALRGGVHTPLEFAGSRTKGCGLLSLFNAFGSPTTGGQSDYGVRKGMIEHLIFTLIAVRDWDAKRIDSPREQPFHQADVQSFKPDVIDAISVSIMGAMEEAMQNDTPPQKITITGKNVVVKEDCTHGADEWEDSEAIDGLDGGLR